MKTYTAVIMGACFPAIFLAFVFSGWAAGAAATPKVPKGWTFTFPEGNASFGKTVFIDMKCYTCHAIDVPGEKLPSRSKGTGPDLTAYAGLPREYLAESIIKSHTVVAAPGYTVKEGRPAMGEYNHFLTVQELIDLVAFLKQKPKGSSN